MSDHRPWALQIPAAAEDESRRLHQFASSANAEARAHGSTPGCARVPRSPAAPHARHSPAPTCRSSPLPPPSSLTAAPGEPRPRAAAAGSSVASACRAPCCSPAACSRRQQRQHPGPGRREQHTPRVPSCSVKSWTSVSGAQQGYVRSRGPAHPPARPQTPACARPAWAPCLQQLHRHETRPRPCRWASW